MKHKLITTLLMSSSLLFSSSIVGAWTIDKSKAEELFKAHANNEMEQFVISMMTTAIMDMEFKEDESCTITTKERTKCWKKASDNSYILYEEDGSDKGAKAEVIDENRLEVIIDEELKFYFNRENTSH